MDKLTKGILIGGIIGLIIGGMIGYFVHGNFSGNFPKNRGDFQISDEAKTNVENFFSSTTDVNEINSYCETNRANCFYYCRSINPDNEICGTIIDNNRMGAERMEGQ